jgi:alkylation response protein AidB-like acyl-CoA dehydrogenase
MQNSAENGKNLYLQTLPGDDVRQIMWRYADRYDLAMLVQSARSVARGIVARLVANGARNIHEWTPEKEQMLKAFDEAGITSAFMEPEEGGYIAGPKNLALALIAFELSWVDAGAATASLAGNLGLSPIHECGTPEQKQYYMSKAVPPQPGENRKPWRYAFALTEPLPYVGVDTGVLSGKVRVAEWKEGEEPILHVEKRGRFITNMAYANVVTAAVDSDDPRIKGSCMVILEETDPGIFDRGTPTKKLVHQLSSTCDPVFSLKVPASRIIGGYTIKDGVIVPNYNHSEVIEAVFKRTRVTVGLMGSAKLLSAIEPIIRYQRNRFRGGGSSGAGSPRYELGLQQKEDATHRLVDIWASGEASASLGFEAARVFDQLDPLEREVNKIFEEKKIAGRAKFKALMEKQKDVLEFISLEYADENARNQQRYEQLKNDPIVRYIALDALANVLCPACKLYNTGHGAAMMREAVSLMGGYGITEDCPGFLFHKWVDAQLEATYEGPEAVQRLQLSITMTNEVFLAMFREWIKQMRRIGEKRPGTGACALATAMQMWLWTLNHLMNAKDANGNKLYTKNRQGVTFPMADALCWLLSTRQFILDVLELEEKGPSNPNLVEGLPGLINFYSDLCHVQTARAAGEVGKICAELVFGYNRHPMWGEMDDKHCYRLDELDVLEGIMPGIASGARTVSDSVSDASRPPKAGPCVCLENYSDFLKLRVKLDGCLTGARLAKDRAAESLTKVMIPEALDYPA